MGRVRSGSVKPGDELHCLSREGKILTKGEEVLLFLVLTSWHLGKVTKVIGTKGISKYHMDSASAGNIIGVAGFGTSTVTETLCNPSITSPIPADPIDPPVCLL